MSFGDKYNDGKGNHAEPPRRQASQQAVSFKQFRKRYTVERTPICGLKVQN